MKVRFQYAESEFPKIMKGLIELTKQNGVMIVFSAGFVMASSYFGYDVNKPELLMSYLTTPPIPSTEEIYCLTCELYVNGPFVIYLLYAEAFGNILDIKEEPIVSLDGLGPSWHPLTLLVKHSAKNVSGQTFRIVFRGTKSAGEYITAGLSQTNLTTGKCPLQCRYILLESHTLKLFLFQLTPLVTNQCMTNDIIVMCIFNEIEFCIRRIA